MKADSNTTGSGEYLDGGNMKYADAGGRVTAFKVDARQRRSKSSTELRTTTTTTTAAISVAFTGSCCYGHSSADAPAPTERSQTTHVRLSSVSAWR